MNHNKQRALVALMAVVVLLLGFLVWRMFFAGAPITQSTETSDTTTTEEPIVAPRTSEDIDALTRVLDNTQVEDSTASDLESETTFTE